MSLSLQGPMRTYEVVKRIEDVVVAGVALIVLSPVMLATAVAIRVDLGSPVIFRQPRPGRHGEIFEIRKFRTMREPDPERGVLTDEQRLTKVGILLRATSLDELPELINVLRGEMSLVGPRPLRVRYLERYSREQSRRHDVRPGITGLAQISGRNAAGWDDRLDLDVEYVDRRCSSLDLRILLATVPKVLRREGISEHGSVIKGDFYGPRRIDEHELRTSGDRCWDLVDRHTGDVAARCSMMVDEEGTAEVSIVWIPEMPAQRNLVERALEMLVGVGREVGASALRLAVRPGEVLVTDSARTLGFHTVRGAEGGGCGHADHPAAQTEVLVRELEHDTQ